jgi:hypothetical protein
MSQHLAGIYVCGSEAGGATNYIVRWVELLSGGCSSGHNKGICSVRKETEQSGGMCM